MKISELLEKTKQFSREEEEILDVVIWTDAGKWGNPSIKKIVRCFKHPTSKHLVIECE